MKKYLFLLLVLIAIAALAVIQNDALTPIMRTATIGGVSVKVEIADTPRSREQGLSGRASLQEGRGMLFIFDTDGLWGMWMKDMSFPIDIIFADSAGEITSIYRSVSPDTYPEVFYPTAPARYVLELPAGFAAAHGIAVGSKIVIQ